MRLFELEIDHTDKIRLIPAVGQIKSDLEKGKSISNNVEDLVDYLQKNDINISAEDLFDLYKLPPLNQVISNIQGDEVVFKSKEDDIQNSDQESEQEKTVAQMAKKAMK